MTIGDEIIAAPEEGKGPTPVCPRCLYDLSGVIDWSASTVLIEAQCSECGLRIECARLFKLSQHPWLFEYHWRGRPVFSLGRTLMRLFTPGRFWREVRIDDPIHLRPVILLVALTAMLIALGFGIAAATDSVGFLVPLMPETNFAFPQLDLGVPWMTGIANATSAAVLAPLLALIGPIALLIVPPLSFGLIPTTLRRAKVRPAHIARIGLYSVLPPMIVLLLWSTVQASLCAGGWLGAANRLNPWWHMYQIFDRPEAGMYGWVFRHALPGLLAMLPVSIWVAWFWLKACHRYLRLDRAPDVVLAMLAIGFLCGLLLELGFT